MSHHEFSEYVKQRADSLGLSMSELSRQSGISRQGLYNLLDGTTEQGKISTLIALSKVLQVHPMILFRYLLHQMDLPKFSTSSAKYQFDASGFVRDVTIPDNSAVITDQVFTKIWEIQNIGHVDWDAIQNRIRDRRLHRTAEQIHIIGGFDRNLRNIIALQIHCLSVPWIKSEQRQLDGGGTICTHQPRREPKAGLLA